MKDWKLGADGFIMHYMVAGPKVKEYTTRTRSSNQLTFEGKLRSFIGTEKEKLIDPIVKLGKKADNGSTWKPYYSYGSYFIDLSSFYSTLQRVDLNVATSLCVEEDIKVDAVVWTYMAVGIYCNGQLIGEQKPPTYKPIQKKEIILPLKKGKNLIYLKCENLGVRDTKNIIGMEIKNHQDRIKVQLPDYTYQDKAYEDIKFLDHIEIVDSQVVFPSVAPKGTYIIYRKISPDYDIMSKPPMSSNVSGMERVEIPKDISQIEIKKENDGISISRQLEITERIKPIFTPKTLTIKDNYHYMMEQIAQVGSLDRGSHGFAITNLLARKYTHKEMKKDRNLLFDTLRLIDLRVDCSDFLLSGLLRYMHNYDLDEDVSEKIKEVLLRYRYWMTMDGADAMCFWSENHSLMFYTSAMDVGKLYPEEYFTRAKMTGKKLYEYGRDKVIQWLEDVETYGFEEFLSTVYMNVTFAALLNVIDYAEEEISERASALTDKLLFDLCTHTFKGCVIAPMGRTYRGVIYPFLQGTQAIINLIDTSAPYSYGEGWIAYLATSKYQLPDGLLERTKENLEITYDSGNGKIMIEKNEDYILTSVQSPREETYNRWENIHILRNENIDMDTHEYTKSMNECFHGTTFFGPGIYGYQQHMWYAGLDPEAVLFVNHPGASSENTKSRPGYWDGNGVMPALKQVHGMLGAIYGIPENHPIHFTHVYCPIRRFTKAETEENWIFLHKGSGYIALWSSGNMVPYNDRIFDCEFRVYGEMNSYLCICGKVSEYPSFESFKNYARSLEPEFDKESLTLKAKKGYVLQYRKVIDHTQYVD